MEKLCFHPVWTDAKKRYKDIFMKLSCFLTGVHPENKPVLKESRGLHEGQPAVSGTAETIKSDPVTGS